VDGGRFVGPQEKTDYSVGSADLKMEIHPDKDTTWTIAHYQYYQDDAWRSHKTVYGVSWEGTTVGDELKRILDRYHDIASAPCSLDELVLFKSDLKPSGPVYTKMASWPLAME
jgi:hypothetical protein